MSAAEDRSWEYTLGRIDERTENIEKHLDRVDTDLTGIKEKMLTKTTLLAALITINEPQRSRYRHSFKSNGSWAGVLLAPLHREAAKLGTPIIQAVDVEAGDDRLLGFLLRLA